MESQLQPDSSADRVGACILMIHAAGIVHYELPATYSTIDDYGEDGTNLERGGIRGNQIEQNSYEYCCLIRSILYLFVEIGTT
jgi:hypothetical protein